MIYLKITFISFVGILFNTWVLQRMFQWIFIPIFGIEPIGFLNSLILVFLFRQSLSVFNGFFSQDYKDNLERVFMSEFESLASGIFYLILSFGLYLIFFA